MSVVGKHGRQLALEDLSMDGPDEEFMYCYASGEVAGGCDNCGKKDDWVVMISFPKENPFVQLCASHARILLKGLLKRYLKIRKGDRPIVINHDPIEREGVGSE